MKIEILFPTPTEARDFRHSGVGTPVKAIHFLARILWVVTNSASAGAPV